MQDEQGQWQAQRHAELSAPDSWLGMAGLFWLQPGVNRVGCGDDCLVCLPAGPEHLGDLLWQSGLLLWQPAGGPEQTLQTDLNGAPSILRKFGIPVVVAVNRFPSDTDRELDAVRRMALDAGAVDVAVSDAFARGGEGAEELARAVISAAKLPGQFRFLYPNDLPLVEKLEVVAREIYEAGGLNIDPVARRQLEAFQGGGFGDLPVCIAKTQYSFSHDPKRLGRPQGFRLPIREVRLAAGAGFVYALAGNISTMPGLPAVPAALLLNKAVSLMGVMNKVSAIVGPNSVVAEISEKRPFSAA